MKRWILKMAITVAVLVHGERGLPAAADDLRLPTVEEVLLLAEHLRDYPPWTSDITVIVEFEIPVVPEEILREQVTAFIHRDNEDLGRPTEGSEVTAEIEQEVARLLGEQSLPRRIKERWRMDGLSYRVDEVRTQTGLEVIDEDTPWASGFLYLWNDSSKSADTAKVDYGQRIISVFGPRHGNLQEYRDVWAGGTRGRSSIQLKAGLGMPLFSRQRNHDPDLQLVQDAAHGTHAQFELWVQDVDGERHGREFTYRPRAGGSIRFTTPKSSFTPVFEVETTDADGVVVYSLESKSVNADGIVTEWVEKQRNPESGKIRERNISLLSRTLWEELPADTFSLKRPDGWTFADHRPENIELTDYTGKRQTLPQNEDFAWEPPQKPKRALLYLLIGNSIVLVVAASWRQYQRSRKRGRKS